MSPEEPSTVTEVSPGEPGKLCMGAQFGPVDDRYEVEEELGRGSEAIVYRCRQLASKEQFAAKAIDLRHLRLTGEFESRMEKLQREIKILQELKHDHVVSLRKVVWTSNWCILVTELALGGELFDLLCGLSAKGDIFSEEEAKHIFRQLLRGLDHMHSKNVIHRDMKPENILIVKSESAPLPARGKLYEVKICDFGLSTVLPEGARVAKTTVGTPQYWAPEVMDAESNDATYTAAADFWSLGVTLFVMLCGRYPFQNGTTVSLQQRIRTASFDMSGPAWNNISKDAKDLIRKLLTVEPSQRYGLQECLSHPWVACQETQVDASSKQVTDCAHKPYGSAIVCTGQVEPQQPQQHLQGQSQLDHVETIISHALQNVNEVCMHDDERIDGSEKNGESASCSNELLTMQLSVTASLESSDIALCGADPQLADQAHWTFAKARNLLQHASTVASRCAGTAHHVGDVVLPDLELAIRESESAFALELLEPVQALLADVRKDGSDVLHRYQDFQVSLSRLMHNIHTTAASSKEAATCSSAMTGVMRELKLSSCMLEKCSAFWADVDDAVHRLLQMTDHTRRLVAFSSGSHELGKRVEDRLEEYGQLWKILEHRAQQHMSDQTAQKEMNDFQLKGVAAATCSHSCAKTAFLPAKFDTEIDCTNSIRRGDKCYEAGIACF